MPAEPAARNRAPGAPPRIYLSAPLFTQAQRQWNRRLAAALAEALSGATVLLPQDFRVEDRYNDPRTFASIYRQCTEAIAGADALVAVFDGPDADSGTAFEVGFAAARGVPVIGVRTDYRPGQDRGANLMLSRACARFVFSMSFHEDTDALAAEVARKLRAVLEAGKKPPKGDQPQKSPDESR
ncbi:MAG TPA: nucleoside 2-deoxyribosyltransferase [Planctomycetota bacterium]|nr:nucleoside 2-deoxyribosyltransferase [Planctomycetota bacterium]